VKRGDKQAPNLLLDSQQNMKQEDMHYIV